MVCMDLSYLVDKLDKGGLFSESFSLCLKSPQMGAKSLPFSTIQYPPKEKMVRGVIWHPILEI